MANILVVDDERDVVTLIKFVLEKDGHTVQEAANGLEILKLLGIDPPAHVHPLPDLIILDIMMPLMDGYTAAMRLREHAETRSIPLLILTAKGQMREVFEISPNVKGYIEKPFDPKKLRDRINGLLAELKKDGHGSAAPGA